MSLCTNFIPFIKWLFFSNPLVPCDAITIPKINLYPWKDGYRLAPVHAAPLVFAPIAPSQPQSAETANSDPNIGQTLSPHDFNLAVNFGK